MAAGAKHGLVNAGYRAIDSLSIEKGEPWEATQATRKNLGMLLSLVCIFSHHKSLYVQALSIFPNPPHCLFTGSPTQGLRSDSGAPNTHTHLDSEVRHCLES